MYICYRIRVMDDAAFTTDQLHSLQEYLPTHEEIKTLKTFQGDADMLGQAEKYMRVMMDFPSATKRIECMKYKQQFSSRIFELGQTSKKIMDACEDVKSSNRLKKVLKTILKVGNQMNDGADNLGFSLDSLLKLQSAKAFDNKTTILDYVINLIDRNDKECLSFPDDLQNIGLASRIPLESILSERTVLRKGLDDCMKLLKSIRELDAKDQNQENENGDKASIDVFFEKVSYLERIRILMILM